MAQTRSMKTSAHRISRNKKRYWRKGIDLADVEAYTEELREKERLGLITKSDSDLFFIQKDPADQSGTLKLRSTVTLKCFSNLLPSSAVKPFDEQKLGSKTTRRREAKRAQKITKKSHIVCKKAANSDDKLCDLWEESDVRKYPYLPHDTEIAYLRSTRQILPKVPASVRLPTTALQPVTFPHPGQSYNPTFEDHQELLKRASNDETRKLVEEQKLIAKITSKGDLANEASRLAEDCQGLDIFTNSTALDDEDLLEGDVKPNLNELKPLKRLIDGENRKTGRIRRKERQQKLIKEKKVNEKLNNKRQNEIFRLRSLNKEISSKLKSIDLKVQRRKILDDAKLLKAAKLGKNKFVEPDLELNLSSEVAGSLRLLKPEGNLLEDRYHSLLKRNVVEARRLQVGRRRRYRLKKYEKRGVSEITADYVPR